MAASVYGRWVPDVELVPPDLTAAAGPLREAELLLKALADDRRGLEHLGEGSPGASFREALRKFIEAWEATLWTLSSRAGSLSDTLRRCAEEFAMVDESLAREQPRWLPTAPELGVRG